VIRSRGKPDDRLRSGTLPTNAAAGGAELSRPTPLFHDTANQLTGLTYTLGPATLGTLTYAYDAGGNRTTVGGIFARTGLPQALASATFDAANRIATWSGQALSYDANGNLASDGLTSYTWNARNQLAGLSGAASASFAYDGGGQRRTRTTTGATSYLYDGVNAAQELVGGSATATVLTGGVDEVFQRADGAGTRAVLTDALGSTVALVDASNALQTQYTYEPFGATVTSGAASANPAQFTGRENDGTGLYYYRAVLQSAAAAFSQRGSDRVRRRRRQPPCVCRQQSDRLSGSERAHCCLAIGRPVCWRRRRFGAAGLDARSQV
jgi:hypothetical protein